MGTAVKFGVITGLLICFWVMSEFLLGFHNEHSDIGRYSIMFALIIPFITVYLAIKEKKNIGTEAGTFGNLLETGIVLSLISAAIFGSFFWVYNEYINPECIELILAKEAEKMMSEGLTIDKMTAALEQYKMFSDKSYQLGVAFGAVFMIGTSISAIYSALLRNK